jgi:hypothetical protein
MTPRELELHRPGDGEAVTPYRAAPLPVLPPRASWWLRNVVAWWRSVPARLRERAERIAWNRDMARLFEMLNPEALRAAGHRSIVPLHISPRRRIPAVVHRPRDIFE